jgi:hypothetical protein
MVDPILSARLNVLKQNLQRAADTEWLQKSLHQVGVSDEVWLGLAKTIGLEARQQVGTIDALQRGLRNAERQEEETRETALAKTWEGYSQLHLKSQELFGEFLEFIGGLAFRSRELDERICNVADELIQNCSRDTIGDPWQSVTVPAREEAVSKTLAAIIRLRFPERTIWTVPFAAHEFGHVLMEECDPLKKIIDEYAPVWRDLRVRFGGSGRIMSKARARAYLGELLADAFATYYMGPAYPAAAIHLRFDPTTALREDEEHPSDLRRAYVILSMLEQMNKKLGLLPYREILNRLRSDWAALCRRNGHPKLESSHETRLDDLVATAYGTFGTALLPAAEYPLSGYSGWSVASGWQARWQQEAEANGPLSLPDGVTKTSRLRDALNAAWVFRIMHPAEVRDVTDVALRLCEEIIQARSASAATKRPLAAS